MKHTTQKTSQKLYKLGVKSESGYWHQRILQDEWKLGTNDDWTEHGILRGESYLLRHNYYEDYYEDGSEDIIPAYTLSDLLQKDALILIFGEEWSVPGKKLAKLDWGEPYIYHSHQIKDKHIEGGMEAVSKYLEEYLK